VPLTPRTVAGLINLRGEIVTVVDLRTLLQLPPHPPNTSPMNVVVRVTGEPVSLLVDVVGDVIEVSEDDFEPQPETISGVAHELLLGVYKLPDRVLQHLDVEKAISLVKADQISSPDKTSSASTMRYA
jgi:purine-binding chemotaxis protein CheW